VLAAKECYRCNEKGNIMKVCKKKLRKLSETDAIDSFTSSSQGLSSIDLSTTEDAGSANAVTATSLNTEDMEEDHPKSRVSTKVRKPYNPYDPDGTAASMFASSTIALQMDVEIT
jgi:hypothetical protein